jgi:hypothetical protein
MRPQRQGTIALVAISLISAVASAAVARQAAGQTPAAVRTVCDPEEQPLFICETNRKDKYIAICAVEEEVGKRWSAVQYRFGLEHRAELVYPAQARDGASKLFFSHIEEGTIACGDNPYAVTVPHAKAPRKTPPR